MLMVTGGMVGELPQPVPLRYEPRNPYSDLLVRAALADLARLSNPPATGSAAVVGGEYHRLRRGVSRGREPAAT
jgi:hypothetical protein